MDTNLTGHVGWISRCVFHYFKYELGKSNRDAFFKHRFRVGQERHWLNIYSNWWRQIPYRSRTMMKQVLQSQIQMMSIWCIPKPENKTEKALNGSPIRRKEDGRAIIATYPSKEVSDLWSPWCNNIFWMEDVVGNMHVPPSLPLATAVSENDDVGVSMMKLKVSCWTREEEHFNNDLFLLLVCTSLPLLYMKEENEYCAQ